MKLFFICTLILLSNSVSIANAAVIASLTGTYDSNKPVHLLVAGYSHGVGLQFVEAAVAQGRRYQELYPNHEVILVRNNESGTAQDANELEALGLRVIKQDAALETGDLVVKVANNFQKIASLEFFSHSSIHAGAGLEGDSERFNIATSSISSLKGRFLANAYIFFHGCNAGFFQAPAMSKLLGIPVYGALTSTDFRRLQINGEWDLNDPREFAAGSWANSNDVSYEQSIPCQLGACLRLAPDNAPYQGLWGSYQGGGLPFYKMFCNNGMSESQCSTVMATALLAWPSIKPIHQHSPESDFLTVAEDFLCPSDLHHHHDCVNALRNSLQEGASEIYSPFQGNTIACDYKSCDVSWTCKYDGNGNAIHDSCSVSAPKNFAPSTMVQELKRYLAGFRQLSEAQ